MQLLRLEKKNTKPITFLPSYFNLAHNSFFLGHDPVATKPGRHRGGFSLWMLSRDMLSCVLLWKIRAARGYHSTS